MIFDDERSSNFGSCSKLRWNIALDCAPRVVAIGISTHGLHGAERYQLPDVWCLHLYNYDAAIRIGDIRLPIRPGCAGVIAPDVPIEYEYSGPSQHLYVHFRVPTREQHASSKSFASVPAMQEMGQDYAALYGRMEQIVSTAGQPAYRAAARVWDVLCDLSTRSESPAGSAAPYAHPAVRRAVRHIAMHLGNTIRVDGLAEHAGVSYGYLSTLFQAAFETTVVGYIRARRMERADYLLRHSSLSIKEVAAAVGIPDLHQFNKFIRRAQGKPPRDFRLRGSAEVKHLMAMDNLDQVLVKQASDS